MLAAAGACGRCRHFDEPSGECRAAPPIAVVDRAGNLTLDGWLVIKPDDRCPDFTPKDGDIRSCLGCRWFARTTEASRGNCHGARPRAPTDNFGVPISRSAMWLEVSAKSLCGVHEVAPHA